MSAYGPHPPCSPARRRPRLHRPATRRPPRTTKARAVPAGYAAGAHGSGAPARRPRRCRRAPDTPSRARSSTTPRAARGSTRSKLSTTSDWLRISPQHRGLPPGLHGTELSVGGAVVVGRAEARAPRRRAARHRIPGHQPPPLARRPTAGRVAGKCDVGIHPLGGDERIRGGDSLSRPGPPASAGPRAVGFPQHPREAPQRSACTPVGSQRRYSPQPQKSPLIRCFHARNCGKPS